MGIKIPHGVLKTDVLRQAVMEIVTRDGTDHSNVKTRVEVVLQQLENGSVELYFDEETMTCSIISVSTK